MNYVLADITRRTIGLYYYLDNGNRVFETFNNPIPLAIAWVNGRFEIGQAALNAVENGVQEAYADLFDVQGQPLKCNDIESKQFIPEVVRIMLDDLFDHKFFVKFRTKVDQVSLLLLFGNDIGSEERKNVYEGLRNDGFAELHSLIQAVEAVKYFQSSPRYNWSRETDAMVVLSDNKDLSIKCFDLTDYHLTFERRYPYRGRDPRFEWAVRKLWKEVQSYTYCEEEECVPYIEKQLDAFLTQGKSEMTSLRLPDKMDYQVFLNREQYNVYSPPDANMFASLISDVVGESGLKYETTGIVLQGYAAGNKFFRESFNQFDPVSDETQEFRAGIRNYILKQFLGGTPVLNTELGDSIVRGVVMNDGGSKVVERGVCWSVNHEPTVKDSHVKSDVEGDTFTVDLIGLSVKKSYYVRAYAVNSIGVGYGNEVEICLEKSPTIDEEKELPPLEDPNDDGKRKFNMSYTLSSEKRKQFLTVEVEVLDGKAIPFDCMFTIDAENFMSYKPNESFCEKCEKGQKGVLKFGPHEIPIPGVKDANVLFAHIWPADKNISPNVFKKNHLKIKLS